MFFNYNAIIFILTRGKHCNRNTSNPNTSLSSLPVGSKGIGYIGSHVHLLPTGSKERGVLGVGSIPAAILSSCQHMKILHHNCIKMNKVS